MTLPHTSDVRAHANHFSADPDFSTEHPALSDGTELNAKRAKEALEAIHVYLLNATPILIFVEVYK
jgi:hypothetical protein